MAPYTLLKRFSASFISSQPSLRKPEKEDVSLVLQIKSHDWFWPAGAVNGKHLTLLYFSLSALEEVEGIRRFGVDVLHNRENIQDVLLCEGRLVAAVKVILFYQDLEGGRTAAINPG